LKAQRNKLHFVKSQLRTTVYLIADGFFKFKEELAKNKNSNIQIQLEPIKKKGFGAPDFKVINVEAIIGYVENKKLKRQNKMLQFNNCITSLY